MANSHEYRTLIGPVELADGLGQAVIFDVRFSLADPQAGQKLYQADHIPGARFLDLDRDLSGRVGPSTGRHPLPDVEPLAEKLAAAGVSGETQVVAYDDSSGAFAARLWWLLRWMGHDRVAVLEAVTRLGRLRNFLFLQRCPSLSGGSVSQRSTTIWSSLRKRW